MTGGTPVLLLEIRSRAGVPPAILIQQVAAYLLDLRLAQPDHLAHEAVDSAVLVDPLEQRQELRGPQRHLVEHDIALEKISDDVVAFDAEQLEQHRGADPGAIAPAEQWKSRG